MPARKTSSTSPSKSPPAAAKGKGGKAPATRSAAPRKSAPSRGLAKPAASKPAPSKKPSRPIPTSISPERKLDFTGMALAGLGLVILLSLLSPIRGEFTAWLIDFFSTAVGWGVYLLPLALLGVGLWLVLRNIEKLPQISVERLLGLVLLFVNFLAFSAWFSGAGDPASAGGSLGAWVANGLVGALGRAGTFIVLLAWLLIGLALTLDVSIPEIFRWMLPVWALLKRGWTSLMKRRAQRSTALEAGNDFDRLDSEEIRAAIQADHYTPLQRGSEDGGLTETQPLPPAQGSGPQPGMPTVTLGQASSASIPEAAHTTPWVLPPVETILEAGLPATINDAIDQERAQLIVETLRSFGAPGHIVEIHRGPTITQFGVEPDFVENRSGRTRVRVSKIVSLADDLALALAAPRIRIQAPVPGRSYVGIEVPNTEISRVQLRDIVESDHFKKIRSPLRFALGKDVAGKPVSTDLAAMPHLLIAGTTGSGKSVCVNALLCCLLINNTPDDLRLILVDPKRVELTGYNGIPHLLAPVVVDAERVVGALQWMLREMDNRYHKFAQVGARNIVDYNNRLQASGQKRIPYLVVVIDELADLMMLAPDETERSITRLAQLARATGIHMVLATQRPSVDVLTGLIKANFPARIAFAVASGVDSRVILDQPGAERLLGRGDMLFQAPDAPTPVRLQGAFVSDLEIQALVEYWRSFSVPEETTQPAGPILGSEISRGVPLKQTALWDDMEPEKQKDPVLDEAIALVRKEGRASISMLQRRMRVGYTRAARLIDTMEEMKIIGPAEANSQVRSVIDYGDTAPPEEI